MDYSYEPLELEPRVTMHDKNEIEELKKRYPGRADQITEIQELIGKPEDATPPCLFIYGSNASGKSLILKSMFTHPTYPIAHHTAWIDCHEAFTLRLIFDHILRQWIPSIPEEDAADIKSCDSMDEFVAEVKRRFLPHTTSTRYLIFDCAENLMESTTVRFIPSLLKLAELAIHIATLDCPANEAPGFYMQFAELLYSAVRMSCRDLNEFRHVVQLLFPKFVEPVLQGKATRDQLSKLFGLVQGHVRQALHSLYLRDMSSADWINKNAGAHGSGSLMVQGQKFVKNSFDLPFYSKFLLISAFLASYNPPRLDNRFFTRGQDDKKKNRVMKNLKNSGMKWRQQLLGPKVFPLERMLAIFYSICDDDIDPGFQLETQVSTLVSLRLLTRVGGTDLLENNRFKCNASFEYVKSISQSVRFDIVGHLFDFVDE